MRTCNKCEIKAFQQLEKEGYEVFKNGFPDFVAVDWKKKKVRFIEIKPLGKKLKPRQLKMKEIFELIHLEYETMFVDEKGTIPRTHT